MKIKTKTQMYDLYRRGLFGNTLRTWTYDEYMCNSYDKPVSLRYNGRIPGGPCIIGISRDNLDAVLKDLDSKGWNHRDFVICEGCDDSTRTIQGEICRSENFYDLTYTDVKEPMRPALKKCTLHAQGLMVTQLLRFYMDPDSYNDLMELLETYPDAVVEFTCGNEDLGICPHRNTIIWEVRNY